MGTLAIYVNIIIIIKIKTRKKEDNFFVIGIYVRTTVAFQLQKKVRKIKKTQSYPQYSNKKGFVSALSCIVQEKILGCLGDTFMA